LVFEKWEGTSFVPNSPTHFQTLDSGAEAAILGSGTGNPAFEHCEDVNPSASTPPIESRSGGSISYVPVTKQYLLVFVCSSTSGDPGLGLDQTSPSPGAAWFYSTTDNLATEDWSTPNEITGSWAAFPKDTASFDGCTRR
jgi:hypothetical protein